MFARPALLPILLVLSAPAAVGADGPDGGLLPRCPGRESAGGRAGEGGGSGEGRGGGEGNGTPGGGAEDNFPAPFDAVAEALNPANIQRRFDAARGRDVRTSDKPRAPEVPLALFVEAVRPLGALKYENQLSYQVGAFTGDAPTLSNVSAEYVFADWSAARVELIAPDGVARAVGFGYQHTLGVGPRGNWVHGALIQPEVAIDATGFVGGTALYTFAYKPDRESPWTATLSGGANRASFSTRPLGGAVDAGVGSMGVDRLGAGGAAGRDGSRRVGSDSEAAGEESRVWRGYAGGNLFYTFSPRWTVGTEVDAFIHPRFGEYLVMPNVTYRPTKHFFLQAGAGWYEVGGRSQAAFIVRANLLNPSGRRPRGSD